MCLYSFKKTIGQWYYIDQRFFVWMGTVNNFFRLIDQFAFAIDFYLIFRHFTDFSDFSFRWICALHGAKKSADRSQGHTVVVISDDSHTNLCRFIADFQCVILRGKDFQFYIGEVLYGYYSSMTFHCMGWPFLCAAHSSARIA